MERHSYLRTHTLRAERLLLGLDDAAAALRSLAGERGDEQDRRAVTLVREGGLSVVLAHLRAGAALDEHAAPGPVTVQVLDGRVRMDIGDDPVTVSKGQLVAFDAGVRHAVHATEDSVLLITVSGTPGPRDGRHG